MKLVRKEDLRNYRLTARQKKLMDGLPFCSIAGVYSGTTIYLVEGVDGAYEFVATGIKPDHVHAVCTVGKLILSLKKIEQSRIEKLVFGAAA